MTTSDKSLLAALQALQIFSLHPYNESGVSHNSLVSILADLRHLADMEKLDFARALQESKHRHLIEGININQLLKEQEK